MDKTQKQTVIAALLILLVSGCATVPTASEQASANYGDPPQHYEQSIHRYFDETLKDPTSVQYREITMPVKNWMRDALIMGGKVNYGWLVQATVNAKNSYGGYVGFRTYSFLFRGEQIVDSIVPQEE